MKRKQGFSRAPRSQNTITIKCWVWYVSTFSPPFPLWWRHIPNRIADAVLMYPVPAMGPLHFFTYIILAFWSYHHKIDSLFNFIKLAMVINDWVWFIGIRPSVSLTRIEYGERIICACRNFAIVLQIDKYICHTCDSLAGFGHFCRRCLHQYCFIALFNMFWFFA